MTYYVVIPTSRIRGTVYEVGRLAYTSNKFIFKQYLETTFAGEFMDEAELYEFQASDTDELFEQVITQTGYELTVNHELELFESKNNPQCVFCTTAEIIDDSGTWDFTFGLLASLWNSLTKLNNVINVLRCPKSVGKIIPLLLEKYCFLGCLFMYVGTLDEIDNTQLKESVRRLLMNAGVSEDDIEFFGITDILDDVLIIFSQMLG